MEGGNSLFFRHARVISFGKFIPLSWWIPQKERALLAIVAAVFWVCTGIQALQKDAAGASVLAFYGLGLLYTVCIMANLADGARASLAGYRRRQAATEQPRALVQMFGIMTVILACNAAVLLMYIWKGASFTPLDMVCLVIAVAVLGILIHHFGWRGMLSHPFARGFLAAACKALPQTLLAALFLWRPQVAAAFTFWSLGSLAALSLLRFWPSLLAFKRQPSCRPLQGVMLSETTNLASVLFMCMAWL